MRTNEEIYTKVLGYADNCLTLDSDVYSSPEDIMEMMKTAQREALEAYRKTIIRDIPVIRGRRFNSIEISQFINGGQK